MIQLTKFCFKIIAETALTFPANDRGFKGSAWHGRIDQAIRQNADLTALLKPEIGAAAHYWVDAPEDVAGTVAGPFCTQPYQVNRQFDIGIVIVGEQALNYPNLSDWLVDAIARAGKSETAGFFGKFALLDWHKIAFPLARLQVVPPPPSSKTSQLQIQLLTMLRLGEGEHMQAAKQALMQGQMAVPRLQTLVERQVQRARALPLSDAINFDAWLQTLQNLAGDIEAQTTVVTASVAPFDLTRLSAKARATQPIGGLLGAFTYAGPAQAMAEFLPLFKLGEWIHIGRKTGLGLGRFTVSLTRQ